MYHMFGLKVYLLFKEISNITKRRSKKKKREMIMHTKFTIYLNHSSNVTD